MGDKEMNEISPSSTSSSIHGGSTSPLSSSSLLPSSSQSIKLIVKAPIQTVEDKIVDCDLTWTVAKLKAHISEIYPNKPSVNDQRLIYSGHLLKNDQVLGDILKAPSDNSTYTVHLVCNVKSSYSTKQPQQSQQKQVNSEQPSSQESSNQMSDQAQNVAPSVAESNTEPESPNNTQTEFNQNHQHLFSQATLAGLFSGYPFVLPTNYPWTNFVNPTESGSDFSLPSTNLGGASVSMSLDQLTQNVAWMSNLLQFQMFQQMYAQYLAQHMNQAALTLSPPQLPDVCLLDGQLPTQITSAAVSTSAAVPQPSQRNINNANNNNNNNIADAAPVQEPIVRARLEPAAPVPGVRLNPAPAVAPVDEEEDIVQRDWIDWLSLITRAVALASFIYLYASFGRFMLVTVLYFLYRFITSAVEAYNAFLTIGAPRQPVPGDQLNNHGANNDADNHNNNNNNNNNNIDNNNIIPNDDQNHLQQVMDGNIDNHHANNNSNNDNNPVDGRRSSNEQSKIRLLFTMVKALFSSLIPLQPPPLYPNRG